MGYVSANEIKQRKDKFIAFLQNRGVEIFDSTSEWELVRFKTNRGTSIIYTNKHGDTTFTGESEEAWKKYRCGKGNFNPQISATKRQRVKSVTIQTLLKRDGNLCFYCGQPINEGEESEEHLLSLVHGGSNHISNKALTHHLCNNMAMSLPLMKKIEIHTNIWIKIAARNHEQSITTPSPRKSDLTTGSRDFISPPPKPPRRS